jgi:TATA-binding protein-associated factor Taf7
VQAGGCEQREIERREREERDGQRDGEREGGRQKERERERTRVRETMQMMVDAIEGGEGCTQGGRYSTNRWYNPANRIRFRAKREQL